MDTVRVTSYIKPRCYSAGSQPSYSHVLSPREPLWRKRKRKRKACIWYVLDIMPSPHLCPPLATLPIHLTIMQRLITRTHMHTFNAVVPPCPCAQYSPTTHSSLHSHSCPSHTHPLSAGCLRCGFLRCSSRNYQALSIPCRRSSA